MALCRRLVYVVVLTGAWLFQGTDSVRAGSPCDRSCQDALGLGAWCAGCDKNCVGSSCTYSCGGGCVCGDDGCS